jgi:hypothetical protein
MPAGRKGMASWSMYTRAGVSKLCLIARPDPTSGRFQNNFARRLLMKYSNLQRKGMNPRELLRNYYLICGSRSKTNEVMNRNGK